MEKRKNARNASHGKEPEIIVKRVGRLGGLDSIHVSLIILVLLLIAVLLVTSYSKPISVRNTTAENCTYGMLNGTCISPIHTQSEVAAQAERILASYGYINSSLSLLPYYSDVGNMSISYIPTSREWLVRIPVLNAVSGAKLYASLVMYDSNLSLAVPYLQTVAPSSIVGNRVVSEGVILASGKFACEIQNPLQVYLFIDPYAPGSISGLEEIENLSSRFGGKLNVTVKVLYGPYSQIVASQYGAQNAQALGQYILCASMQRNFSRFVGGLNAIYSNSYVPAATLSQLAKFSGINSSLLDSCMANATSLMNRQALLAKFYNITSTPIVVTDCMYLSLPQTTLNAICYANSTICK
ncbi:MAG: hypothetical protein ACP5K9_03220 [Candidatus Micrarchaeia archaeon]